MSDQNIGAIFLVQPLEPGRNIHIIAMHGEDQAALGSDGANGHFTAIDAASCAQINIRGEFLVIGGLLYVIGGRGRHWWHDCHQR